MNKVLQRSKKNLKNKKGFTLIELIVVIVIIGILAAIVVPRLAGFTSSADKSAAEADARTILTAASAYYAENREEFTSSRSININNLNELVGDVDDLKGTLAGNSISVGTSGAISFTYTLGEWTVRVEDGSIKSVTDGGTPGGDENED